MENISLKELLKGSKLKGILFGVLFLFVSLVPLVPAEISPVALGAFSMQPILVLLVFFIDKIDNYTASMVPSALLYASLFLLTYFFIYFITCLLAEFIVFFSSAANKGKNKNQGG